MTAMPNDVLRVKEIDRLIDDLHRRLDAFNLDERTVLSPRRSKRKRWRICFS